MSDVRLIDANVLKAVFVRADDDQYYTIEVKNVIDNSPTVETYTKDDMTNEYLKGYNACKNIIQPKGEWIPVKDIINYIRICREELFEKMKDYHPREFEIRDNMLLNFEQMVKLANSKYKQI